MYLQINDLLFMYVERTLDKQVFWRLLCIWNTVPLSKGKLQTGQKVA